MTEVRIFHFNALQENTMILTQGTDCLIVDPAPHRNEEILELDKALEGLNPLAIILTHAHFDHIFGVKRLQDRYGLKVYMHPLESATLDYNAERCHPGSFLSLDQSFVTTPVGDGQHMEIGPFRFDVIWTPGHTKGSVCYHFKEDGFLLTGDTLFAGCIGRTDLGPGDYDDEIRSIMDKIMALDGSTRIFPGHAGSSTLSHERTDNPFLEPFNEPEEIGAGTD